MKKNIEIEKSVGMLLNDVAWLLRRNFDRRSKPLGLTRLQWTLLVTLVREEGVNQATLAERLEIEPISLVRILDRLEKDHLVERRLDPNDRRARLIYLGDQAESVLEKIWAIGTEARKDALSGFEQADVDQMMSYLIKMKINLSAKETLSVPHDNEMPNG